MLVAAQSRLEHVRRHRLSRGGPAVRTERRTGKPYPWLESLTFPAVVLAANLPWSIPALFALRPAFLRGLDDRTRLLVQLLHCWAWPNLLFWSLPAQHNVRYVLPICPAITLLGVIVVLQCAGWSRVHAARGFALAAYSLLFSVLLAWAVVKVVFVEAVVPIARRTATPEKRVSEIARLVPQGEILYLCRLKDEGVLFYYGRPSSTGSTPPTSRGTARFTSCCSTRNGTSEFAVGPSTSPSCATSSRPRSTWCGSTDRQRTTPDGRPRAPRSRRRPLRQRPDATGSDRSGRRVRVRLGLR